MRPAGGRASSRHHSSSRAAGKAAVQRRSDVKQQCAKQGRGQAAASTLQSALTQQPALRRCGLEVPRQLRWHTWHADGEFVKVLAVKNVSGEVRHGQQPPPPPPGTQVAGAVRRARGVPALTRCCVRLLLQVVVFSYRLLPGSCAFSVPFPDAFKLSPGMSASIKARVPAGASRAAASRAACLLAATAAAKLPTSNSSCPHRLPALPCTQVCFRPRARVSHTAALELTCGGSVILVPLEAVLPASKLQLPARLDFGLVPAKEAAALPLPVHNVGDATLAFRWSIAPPFAVLPEAGTLAPGQAATCEVRGGCQ